MSLKLNALKLNGYKKRFIEEVVNDGTQVNQNVENEIRGSTGGGQILGGAKFPGTPGVNSTTYNAENTAYNAGRA